MTTYFCAECGEMFLWVRKGVSTMPDECPFCGSERIDVVEG